MAGNAKSVDLVVRARDETQRALNSAKTALDRLRQAQERTAARRNLLSTAKAEAEAAATAYRDAAAASEKLGRATQGGVAGTKKQKAAFEESRRAALEARDAYLSANAALARASGRRGSFAAFDAVASGASRAEAGIERLTAAQLRNAAATDRATAAAGRQSSTLARSPATPAQAPSINGLGLRPYEMTNLGYQINDLITQVASGTNPLQALAQQGGQLIQIFPRAATAILRFVPAIAAVTAVVTPFIAAFSRMAGVEKDVKRFEATLNATADAGAYAADDLAGTVRALQDVGVSGDEARKMVQQFVKDGLNPVYFEKFGEGARDLAKITGEELVDANKMLSEGLSGSYEDFKKLDDVLNVATVSERRRIRELFESGRAEEARRMAAEITFRQLDAGAAKLDGPWSRAAKNFGRWWNNMLESVGNWPIVQGAIELIDRLGRKLEWVTRLMAGAAKVEAEAGSIASGHARLADIDRQLAENERNPNEGQRYFRRERLLRDRVRIGTEVATAENTLRQQMNSDVIIPTERAGKEGEDRALAQRPRATGGSSAASEAEQRAKAQAEFVEGLKAENAEREFQLAMLDETERQQRILTAIREAEIAAHEVELELTAQQRAEIEGTVGALYDAEQALKAAEVIERARLDLAKARGEEETKNAYVARRLAEDTEGWLWSQRIAYAGLLAAQWDVEEATRKRADAEKAVADQVALRDSLMESIAFYEAQGDRGRVADLKSQLRDVNAELARSLDLLIAYWSTFDTPEARAAVENLTRQRDAVVGTGKAAGIAAAEIESALSQGALSAFDRFTARLAETRNLFTSLRDAFLQFAADFLSGIAKMIAQQAILNLLKGDRAQGFIGQAANFLSAIVRHGGGLTSGGGSRMVPLAAYAGAFRYHTGGIAGFKPDEVPAVLRRGEEVLTEDNPRHRNNGGGAAVALTAKFVNVLDPTDILNRALSNDEGERIFMNFLTRNSQTVSGIIR